MPYNQIKSSQKSLILNKCAKNYWFSDYRDIASDIAISTSATILLLFHYSFQMVMEVFFWYSIYRIKNIFLWYYFEQNKYGMNNNWILFYFFRNDKENLLRKIIMRQYVSICRLLILYKIDFFVTYFMALWTLRREKNRLNIKIAILLWVKRFISHKRFWLGLSLNFHINWFLLFENIECWSSCSLMTFIKRWDFDPILPCHL